MYVNLCQSSANMQNLNDLAPATFFASESTISQLIIFTYHLYLRNAETKFHLVHLISHPQFRHQHLKVIRFRYYSFLVKK
ncbi:hypothetical protein BpHYR1_023961 [Brachionus plicatilis]|uniref:Uncharacterized protein n=1 Tax=Brachionus plicatilis TaxID=10195 RepID=A0A3M7SQ83_BRAPC|nr:hypothetical protein BpHYR1_023961 [Brachionus plicatilis]